MKLILLAFLFCMACSSEPKTPAVCQHNLRFCFMVQRDHRSIPAEEWHALCLQDEHECKSNWGMD